MIEDVAKIGHEGNTASTEPIYDERKRHPKSRGNNIYHYSTSLHDGYCMLMFHFQGLSGTVGRVLGSLSCVLQRCWFDRSISLR